MLEPETSAESKHAIKPVTEPMPDPAKESTAMKVKNTWLNSDFPIALRLEDSQLNIAEAIVRDVDDKPFEEISNLPVTSLRSFGRNV